MTILREQIFSVTPATFDQLALEIFHFQFEHNPVYKTFAKGLGKTPGTVTTTDEIPFLPVELFKTHLVYASELEPELVFTSSGTTGAITSRHPVAHKAIYEESFMHGFGRFYGDPSEWIILALLPSYLEREGSSLVYMADQLINRSGAEESGFFLHNYRELSEILQKLNAEKKKTLLLGVTYALLDLAEQFPQALENIVVMETGGMKGKRKEMIREELHEALKKAFHIPAVHSEYGMTELLSQAYSRDEGIFQCPPWMKIVIREMNDPLTMAGTGKTGGVNIIDLANVYSCSFLATSDLGRRYDNGSFEVLGRFDNSDVRGCNLMVE